MNTGQALLANIIANPDDDVARLVYADWLEEAGDNQRAEFIRGQIQLAAMQPWDEGYTALDIRCRQLERANHHWPGRLQPFVKRWECFTGERQQPFERGFPARVSMGSAEFAKHRAYLCSETCITEAHFQDVHEWTIQPELAKLIAVEFASFYRGKLREEHTPGQLVLACLERIPALQHFGIDGSVLNDQEGKAVLSATAVGGVRSLAITMTSLAPSLEETVATLTWPKLRRFVDRGGGELSWLRSPWVSHLEELTLLRHLYELPREQPQLLADLLPTTALRRLRVSQYAMDARGAQSFGKAVAQSSVQSLALAQTGMSSDAARALFSASLLGELRAIFLSGAELDSEVVGRLLGSRLRVCALSRLSVDTLATLERAPGSAELTELRLGLEWRQSGDPFGEQLCRILEAGTLPRLLSLTLCDTTPNRGAPRHSRDCTLRDRVAMLLSNCPAIAGLRELQFGDIITRTGALALANSPYLDGLQLLNVRVWSLDEVGESALRQRFGNRVYLDTVNRDF